MSLLLYIERYPVKSLPVRKQVARAGACPDCGCGFTKLYDSAITEAICSNPGCKLDVTHLISYGVLADAR